MPSTRNQLLSSAQALCTDFASKKDVDTLLSHFSVTHECTAIEHGQSFLAPFLGRPFNGRPGVQRYFSLLAELLTYDEMRFSEYIVDPEVRKVSVKGRAKFKWVKTGNEWDETFVYMLDFEDEGKVTDYQVWADTGAAYLAKNEQLEKRIETKDVEG